MQWSICMKGLLSTTFTMRLHCTTGIAGLPDMAEVCECDMWGIMEVEGTELGINHVLSWILQMIDVAEN